MPLISSSLPLGASAGHLALDLAHPQTHSVAQPEWVVNPRSSVLAQSRQRHPEWAGLNPNGDEDFSTVKGANPLQGGDAAEAGKGPALLLSGLMCAGDLTKEGGLDACVVASTFLATLLDTAQLQAEGVFDELLGTMTPEGLDTSRWETNIHSDLSPCIFCHCCNAAHSTQSSLAYRDVREMLLLMDISVCQTWMCAGTSHGRQILRLSSTAAFIQIQPTVGEDLAYGKSCQHSNAQQHQNLSTLTICTDMLD